MADQQSEALPKCGKCDDGYEVIEPGSYYGMCAVSPCTDCRQLADNHWRNYAEKEKRNGNS